MLEGVNIVRGEDNFLDQTMRGKLQGARSVLEGAGADTGFLQGGGAEYDACKKSVF